MTLRPATATARPTLARVGLAVCAGLVALAAPGCFLFDGLPHQQKDLTAVPPQLDGSEIVDKLGNVVPLDQEVLDETGQLVKLSRVFPTGKPALLILGYWDCPMLCSLVLKATADGLAGVEGLEPGEDYVIITVGIDPTETAEQAKAKQVKYLAELQKQRIAAGVVGKDAGPLPPKAWRFLTAPRDDTFNKHESKAVRALADAVGFGYRHDPASNDYAHGAGIFFVSPDGMLTRTFYGLSFVARDVRLAILEAGKGMVGSPMDRIILSCFQFGPEGKYSLYVWGVMRLAALLMVFSVLGLAVVFFRREAAKERALEADLAAGREPGV